VSAMNTNKIAVNILACIAIAVACNQSRGDDIPMPLPDLMPSLSNIEVKREPVRKIIRIAKPALKLVVVGIRDCAPCKILWAAVERIKPAGLGNNLYVYADDQENAEYVRYYSASGPFPQVLLFRQGKLVRRAVGVMSESALLEWVGSVPEDQSSSRIIEETVDRMARGKSTPGELADLEEKFPAKDIRKVMEQRWSMGTCGMLCKSGGSHLYNVYDDGTVERAPDEPAVAPQEGVSVGGRRRR
jgi:hypothetical protein